jgi:hypothetical protein
LRRWFAIANQSKSEADKQDIAQDWLPFRGPSIDLYSMAAFVLIFFLVFFLLVKTRGFFRK